MLLSSSNEKFFAFFYHIELEAILTLLGKPIRRAILRATTRDKDNQPRSYVDIQPLIILGSGLHLDNRPGKACHDAQLR